MSLARRAFTATVLDDGRVFIAGGGCCSNEPSAEVYDPISNSWSSAGTMSQGRGDHIAVKLLDGRVLIAGGTYLASAEIYNPVGNNWIPAASMSTARRSPIAGLLADGRVLVAGGLQSDTTYLSTSEIYDPIGNTWQAGPAMSVARYHAEAATLNDARILVTGGSDSGGALSSAEYYDETTNSWTYAGSMSTARANHTATMLANGDVLVAGGNATGDSYGVDAIGTTEIYSPVANSWSTGCAMSTPTYLHTATRLLSGFVLISGGSMGTVSTSRSELVNTDPTDCRPTTNMASIRHSHVAALLNDGRVLAAGGYDYVSSQYTAEIYTPDDNCPGVDNPDQLDTDREGLGDACDPCPLIVDCDADSGALLRTSTSGRCIFANKAIFNDCVEVFLGTNPTQKCAATAAVNDEPLPDAWPVDFNGDQKATILDVATFSSVFGSLAPGPPYNVRHDLNANGSITITDIAQYSAFFGKSCSP
jgi:hypothetical protein